MNPYSGDDRARFTRNVVLIALLHVVVIGGLWAFFGWKRKAPSADSVTWLDGGGAPAGGADAQPTPTPEDTPQEDQPDTPAPTPESGRMASPTPEENAPPSEIALPTPRPVLAAVTPVPTPEPTAIPTPKPTPEETPTPHPTAKPKPKVKATPHKPKAKPKSSPHKHPKPKASPHASAHKTPKPDDQDNDDNNDDGDNTPKAAKAKAAKSAFKHAVADGGSSGDEGTAPGTGGGNRGGAGHAGGGNTQGEFGWYRSMLRDRFYTRWNQPTSVAASSASISAVVKIKIAKDGTISDVSLTRSSGNDLVDQSVMEAAHQVTQVDPLPDGLGENGVYEVSIEFQLTQSQ